MTKPEGDIAEKRLVVTGRILLYLLLILHCCSMTAEGAGGAQTGENIEVVGLHSIEKAEFIDLLGVANKKAIDAEILKNGIKRTFLKGIFEDISVEVCDGLPPRVVVRVREKEFIKKLSVKGNAPLSDKKISDLFMLKAGEVMRYDLIDQAKEELKKKLSLRGFPEAAVDVKVERDREQYRVNLYLTIDAGTPLRINSVLITGTQLDVRDIMKTSPGDVYDQTRLNSDLKRIRENLKKQGYYNPSVGPYSYHDGEVAITCVPGKKLSVTLEGNTALSQKDLMKLMPFFEIETFSDVTIQEAIDKMLSLYHEEGYASVQIAPVVSSDENSVHVTFFIFEGAKYRISEIRFIDSKLPPEKLQEVMELKKGGAYNPDILEKDRDSLEEICGALGYLETDIKEFEVKIDEKNNTVEIMVTIQEGERTEISKVEITGVEAGVVEKLLKIVGLKQGDPYNEVDISNARFRILDYYGDSGYSNMDVVVTKKIENHKASIILDVIEGEKKYFGSTIITGNKKTRYEVIKRELVNKDGGPYSFKSLAIDRQKLFKLGLFTDIEIESLNRSDQKNDVLIKLKEGNAGAVEYGFGYADYEKFRGFAEVSYRNLWGMNRLGSARTELSSLAKRLILQYQEPWFMDWPLPFRAFFLFEDKKEVNLPDREVRYKLSRYTVTAGVEKKLSDTVKADLYYEFDLVTTSDVLPDVVLTREDVGTLAISSIKPGIAYDTRDNPFDPSKGVLAGGALKIASPVFLSETNFTKLNLYGSTFHRLHKRIVLAISVRGGLAFGLGRTNELPIVERFFLGGGSTVRGYDQDTLGPKGADGNPTGGDAFLAGNIEFRTFVGRGISLVPFVDMGNVWVKVRDMNVTDLKYTAGIGLRYSTPVGPLRVDYGFKLNRAPGESKGALHFSIGHAF